MRVGRLRSRGAACPHSSFPSDTEAFDEHLHGVEGRLGRVVIGGEPELMEQSRLGAVGVSQRKMCVTAQVELLRLGGDHIHHGLDDVSLPLRVAFGSGGPTVLGDVQR